jgi:hypothetical protein
MEEQYALCPNCKDFYVKEEQQLHCSNCGWDIRIAKTVEEAKKEGRNNVFKLLLYFLLFILIDQLYSWDIIGKKLALILGIPLGIFILYLIFSDFVVSCRKQLKKWRYKKRLRKSKEAFKTSIQAREENINIELEKKDKEAKEIKKQLRLLKKQVAKTDTLKGTILKMKDALEYIEEYKGNLSKEIADYFLVRMANRIAFIFSNVDDDLTEAAINLKIEVSKDTISTAKESKYWDGGYISTSGKNVSDILQQLEKDLNQTISDLESRKGILLISKIVNNDDLIFAKPYDLYGLLNDATDKINSIKTEREFSLEIDNKFLLESIEHKL